MALFLKLCFLIIPLISISYKSFYFGIEIAYIECRKQIAENIDKAKPRVIVGRLPAVIGGGPAWSRDAGGESHGSLRDSRVAER